MMGRQTGDQSKLFYLFNLEGRIPAGHLLRRMTAGVFTIGATFRSGWNALHEARTASPFSSQVEAS